MTEPFAISLARMICHFTDAKSDNYPETVAEMIDDDMGDNSNMARSVSINNKVTALIKRYVTKNFTDSISQVPSIKTAERELPQSFRLEDTSRSATPKASIHFPPLLYSETRRSPFR